MIFKNKRFLKNNKMISKTVLKNKNKSQTYNFFFQYNNVTRIRGDVLLICNILQCFRGAVRREFDDSGISTATINNELHKCSDRQMLLIIHF